MPPPEPPLMTSTSAPAPSARATRRLYWSPIRRRPVIVSVSAAGPFTGTSSRRIRLVRVLPPPFALSRQRLTHPAASTFRPSGAPAKVQLVRESRDQPRPLYPVASNCGPWLTIFLRFGRLHPAEAAPSGVGHVWRPSEGKLPVQSFVFNGASPLPIASMGLVETRSGA